MSRGRHCRHHGYPCSCSMGNLYRFVEPLTLYLLKVKGSVHGYELLNELNRHSLTDSVIETGALYRNLRRMEEEGDLESTWDTESGGPAKRIYRLTEKGEERLKAWVEVISNLARSMNGFVEEVRKILD